MGFAIILISHDRAGRGCGCATLGKASGRAFFRVDSGVWTCPRLHPGTPPALGNGSGVPKAKAGVLVDLRARRAVTFNMKRTVCHGAPSRRRRGRARARPAGRPRRRDRRERPRFAANARVRCARARSFAARGAVRRARHCDVAGPATSQQCRAPRYAPRCAARGVGARGGGAASFATTFVAATVATMNVVAKQNREVRCP